MNQSEIIKKLFEEVKKEILIETKKIESLGGKATGLVDEAGTLTKVVKATKVIGVFAGGITIADNIVKACNSKDSYDQAKYTTKAVVAGITMRLQLVPGIGTAAGLLIFGVATLIEWGW